MSIQAIITQIAAIQKTITGINNAYDESPDSISDLPCFLNSPSSGDIERGASWRETKHIIKMQLFVERGGDLASGENRLRPFLKLTVDKFDVNLRLNGAADRSGITHYDYGVLEYAGTSYLGISFDIAVWEYEGFAFAA